MTKTRPAEVEWTVTGMDCGSCATKIRDAVGRLPGVSDISVALMTERLKLTLDESATPRTRVEATIRSLGYGIADKPAGDGVPMLRRAAPAAAHTQEDHDHADPIAHDGQHGPSGRSVGGAQPDVHGHAHDDPADRGRAWYQGAKGRLVILTAVLLGLAWGADLLLPEGIGSWAFVLACLIGLAPVARRAVAALRFGQPFTIESLMTIAALGALFIGAAQEAALVVFLFAVGEVLEGIAANRARDGIRALARLVPKTAQLEIAGQVREVPAESLLIGQTVVIRPGDRVPADGDVVEGLSGVDESPVTGESVPVAKGPGDPVFAGSINAEAVLKVTVTKTAADNTIARIIRLVEEAEEARAPTERFIDRFSRWYMPAIVALAALVVLVPPLAFAQPWDTWIYRGLALLLIGCPCALVVSVPASIASALSTGARRGLLMKGGAVVEAAAGVSRVAFDKTGTLTHGRPVVTDLVPAPGVSETELLAVAGGVETGSAHPLARAILDRLAQASVAAHPSRDAKAVPGKGVEAIVEGARASVSAPRHASAEAGIADGMMGRVAALEDEGKTVVAVYRDRAPLGLIAMRDEARPDAAAAMRQLTALGVEAVMLTGDNARTAAAVAGELGMDFRAEMMPEDKLVAIRGLGGAGGVMMIGDGINDAPALKQATVGVAMGSGTDVALETADAAILRDRVTDIPALIRLARAAMANIRQNVALALGLKAVFLVTSILGITGLWIAIMADTGATVLVTLNALRLLRYDPGKA